MGYDSQNNLYDDPNVTQAKIKFPEEELTSETKKNNSTKPKRQRKSKREEYVEEPINVKWLIFGCLVVALLFALFTGWTSAPSEKIIEANHVQRAKYRKYKVVSEGNREAHGFSKTY